MRCEVHPDTTTAKTCALCGRYFCDACLTPTPLGEACPGCAPAAREAGPPERTPRGALGLRDVARGLGHLLFWGAVVAPLAFSALYALDLRDLRAFVEDRVSEPRRLGESIATLVEIGAEVEAGEEGRRLKAGALDVRLDDRPDPFGPGDQPLFLTPVNGIYLLCSVGPDRSYDGGSPMDRFTGKGDLCLNLGPL